MYHSRYPSLSCHCRASATLSILASVVGGLLLTMLFLNLTRYVGATSALEQATRRTARCLTPTDAACVSYQAVSQGGPRNWYQVQTPERLLLQTDERIYTASMNELRLKLNYSVDLEHIVSPSINYSTFQVPVREYRPNLNPFETVSVPIFTCGQAVSEGTPLNPYFPGFNLAYERARDDTSPNSWLPYRVQGGNTHEMTLNLASRTPSVTGPVRNSANDYVFSFAEDFTAPNPVSDPNASLSCVPATPSSPGGSPCNLPNQAQYPWSNYARLVVKPSALITDNIAPVGTHLAWANLRIETWDSQGRRQVRDLGGRDTQRPVYGWSFLPNNQAYFNMWVRGPVDSHGGNSGISHGNIVVERGQPFRISGSLIAQHNDVNVNVTLKVYYDEIDYREGAIACEWLNSGAPIPQLNSTAELDGPAGQSLLLDTNRFVRWVNASSDKWPAGTSPGCVSFVAPGRALDSCRAVRAPSCDATALTFATNTFSGLSTLSSESNCEKSLVVADPNWRPSATSDCPAAPMGRSYCDWSVPHPPSEFRELLLSSAPAEINPVSRRHECGRELSSTVSDWTQCRGARELHTNLLQAVAQSNFDNQSVDTSAPQLAPPNTFPAPVELEIAGNGAHPLHPAEYWSASWTSSAATESCLTDTATSSCRYDGELLSAESPPILERNDGAFSHVNRELSFAELRAPDGSAAPAARLAEFPLSIASRSRRQIEGGYPFTGGAVHQVLYSEADRSQGSDCPAEYRYPGTLEAKLREFASQLLPPASDPTLLFSFTESAPNAPGTRSQTYTTHLFASLNPAMLRCTPVHSIVETDVSNEQVVYLGEFDSQAYPRGPATCLGRRCFSEPVGEIPQLEAPTLMANLDAARLRGQTEFSHFAPGVDFTNNCNGAGCGSLEVVTEGELATVTAFYNLPILPPLSTFLGTEFLRLESSVSEALEMRLAGADREGD